MPWVCVTLAEAIHLETIKAAERLRKKLGSSVVTDELLMSLDQLAVDVTRAFERARMK